MFLPSSNSRHNRLSFIYAQLEYSSFHRNPNRRINRVYHLTYPLHLLPHKALLITPYVARFSMLSLCHTSRSLARSLWFRLPGKPLRATQATQQHHKKKKQKSCSSEQEQQEICKRRPTSSPYKRSGKRREMSYAISWDCLHAIGVNVSLWIVARAVVKELLVNASTSNQLSQFLNRKDDCLCSRVWEFFWEKY